MMAMNGIKRIIPAAPQRMPPARIIMIVTKVLMFSLLLTARGKIRFASRY
jgi:hypothetical protein